jgi:hypothetical protein
MELLQIMSIVAHPIISGLTVVGPESAARRAESGSSRSCSKSIVLLRASTESATTWQGISALMIMDSALLARHTKAGVLNSASSKDTASLLLSGLTKSTCSGLCTKTYEACASAESSRFPVSFPPMTRQEVATGDALVSFMPLLSHAQHHR